MQFIIMLGHTYCLEKKKRPSGREREIPEREGN
jgi:hypothetical protein